MQRESGAPMNLEHCIQEWRRDMAAAGISSAGALAELESHLRDEIDSRMRAGIPPDAAFAAAAARLGQPTALKQEFERTVPPWDSMSAVRRPRNVALVAGGMLVAVSALPFVMNTFPEAFAHAFSEHFDAWYLKGYLIMGAVFSAWAWALIRLSWAVVQLNSQRQVSGKSPFLKGLIPKTRLILQFETSTGEMVSFDTKKVAFDTLSLLRRGAEPALLFHGPILVALFYLLWLAGAARHGIWVGLGSSHDPKEYFPTNVVHHAIVAWFWMFIPALLVPLLRIGAALGQCKHEAIVHARRFAATLAMFVVALLYLMSDPHRLLTWFMD